VLNQHAHALDSGNPLRRLASQPAKQLPRRAVEQELAPNEAFSMLRPRLEDFIAVSSYSPH
jgi:hypothetical protein